MISEIEIHYFQIHEKLKIKLTKGFNVIIGDTGEGKTAIIRALSLALENQPRKGEDIYQNRHYKDPLLIQIKDDKGNKILRTKRKYYLNDKLIAKAFGTDLPLPIRQFIPLSSINWQRQFEQHFLIFQTGGSAAKLLNKSTGLEDQELLLIETKRRILEHKSNANRLHANNKEIEAKLNELKKITRHKIRSEVIVTLDQRIDEYDGSINFISECLDDLSTLEIEQESRHLYQQYLERINTIEDLNKQIIESDGYIHTLQNHILELNSCNAMLIKSKNINQYQINLKTIEDLDTQYSQQSWEIHAIQSMLENLLAMQKQYNVAHKSYLQGKAAFEKLLIKYGICPLCNQTYKGEHVC